MAWNVAVGSPTEGMKSLIKDEGSEDLLALVSHELLPLPQDLVRSSGGDRASLKRQHQSIATRQDEADDDDVVDDQANPLEKKRRLTPQQLKFLETSFEMENKLGPERKAIIAQRLGLRPRQVAIWFQNRRARWKNKQLEQDYESLKSKYENAVKENEQMIKDNESVMEENKRLQTEIARITALLQSSVDLHESGNGALDLRKVSYEDQKEQQQQEVGSLLSAKSELASPTKSEDQSEVQDSGRSYPPTTQEVIASETDQMVIMGDFNDAAMMICSYPVVKLEETALVTSEERLGSLFDPQLFHQLAASGVCLEDARCCLYRWEDQSPWLPWYQD